MRYWLMKSEPDVFGIDDLALARSKTAAWWGVRNYQARNFMRDQMQLRDQAFFYHSSCPQPGIVGIAEISKRAYPDETQFDRKSEYYDPAATRENPRWFMVDVQLKRPLARTITLDELRAHADRELKGMVLLRRGNRLSITPVEAAHWNLASLSSSLESPLDPACLRSESGGGRSL
jgi:predicted RNA-binding protein with PUA-like domain